ncbi:MAG: cytochrome P450 [bacterium]|jgi:sterol 14-demethylase|nr:cytochrome P450 [Deltaproteobacteria bacterium]MCP4240700.1 cytochrome P450 [bacterium]HJO23800.1 cytochrome P450 [Myxococcota bacterium]
MSVESVAGTPSTDHPGGEAPPRLSNEQPDVGHLEELRTAPIDLFWRVRNECGEVGEINLAGSHVTLLFGPEAQELFFRAPDEQLDQGEAYPFMKPIFGPGVIFDLPVERRKKAIRTRALRDEYMRRHADVISAETEMMCERLQGSGDFDLLDFFGELTTYTSTATLIGQEFRDDLAQKGSEFATAFQDLERGTDAYAYVDPYMDIPSFHARDAARTELVELITEILDNREEEGRRCQDLLQAMDSLIDENGDKRYSRSEITGMIIGMMLAGHHTSQGAASWALIELLQNPEVMARVVEELDAIYADGRQVSFQSLREIPLLEGVLKETLRMHPPLIILMRKVMHDFHFKNYTVKAGNMVAVSPAVSNRNPDYFPDPDRFDPERYNDDRREDARNPWSWISFGGGRHKCIGSAFALMQLKGIFSILLRRFEFEFAQPSESYVNDHSKMVVHLKQPCRVRYRPRKAGAVSAASAKRVQKREQEEEAALPFRVCVDPDLCQGHAVCTGEAPEIFELGRDERVHVKDETPRKELRRKAELAARYCPNHVIRIEDL